VAASIHGDLRPFPTRRSSDLRTANRVYDALEALPQIVIAALNGAARAGAAELSLACDIRLAGAHATFALPEALWGGFPGAGGPRSEEHTSELQSRSDLVCRLR